MAELERLANHLGDIGAICNDASFALMHAHCGILRERVLRAADSCFGHRLMMDRVVPGGVTADLDAAGSAEHLRSDLLEHLRRRFPRLIELYDNTASLQDRTVGTGIVHRRTGTPIRRGRLCRARQRPQFRCAQNAGLCRLTINSNLTLPMLTAGDVDARVWIRIREVEQSLALIDQI